jgi:hypothetical protein
MTVSLWTEDRQTQLVDPIDLGNFVINAEWQKYWLYNSGPESILNLILSIDQGAGTTNAYKNYFIAREFNGHPQAYHDYMNPMKFKVLSAYTWTPLWMRCDIANADITNNPQTARLSLNGEATVS